MILSDLRFRLRAIFQRDAMESELDDELRFHIERETEKYIRAGMTHEEALRKARVEFGGVTRFKEETRDARGITVLDTIVQDLRYGLRGLHSKPAFTAAIVITLGLGIGANAAMFGIVDRLMFRAPAYLTAPERVHRVYTRYFWEAAEHVESGFSYARYLDFVSSTTSFDRVAAVGGGMLAVGARDDAREINVGTVSAAFFQFFDAPPVVGRYFTADEDRAPAGTPVVVLGYAYWRLQYGGSNVLGNSLRIGDAAYTIIGVAPRGFAGVADENAPAMFIPITAFAGLSGQDYVRNYGWTWIDMIVRRKPDVSIHSADADLNLAFARSWALEREQTLARLPSYPSATAAHARAETASLLHARGPDADQIARVATWVMGVALIVLLIACANVTNLLLARAVMRRREIALRLALGVTRRRLIQQLLTESLLLAVLGALVGLAMAQWGGQLVRSLFRNAEDASAVMNDGRTLLFVTAVTVTVAFLTGLAPALHAVRGDVAEALKAGLRDSAYRRSKIRTALLLFQGAFSVVLLVGAGLFVRSLSHVRALRLGYDVAPVAYVEAVRRGTKATSAEVNALAQRLVDAASAIPGVRSASLTISVPFWSVSGRGAPYVPGVDSVRQLGRFGLQAGSPTYFETIGTRIIRGRGFSEWDRRDSAPIVVVSESMAKALWPGKNPLGQIMRIGGDTNPFMTVVGVAEDMRLEELSGKPEFWYYLPIQQFMARFGAVNPTLFVRVNGTADEHVEAIRRALQREMPGDSYVKAVPLGTLVAPRQRSWEFGAKMFVAFGGLALVLAAIGLYSVVAYGVAQRTHEIGIRIALGAGLGDVMRMIVWQGVAFAVAGIAIGSVIALWAGRWVEPLLFSQKAFDPVIYASVGSVLLVVALVATLQPALRATRVDPNVALRSD